MCDQGPALLVNGHAITRLTPARIDAICELIRGTARRSPSGRPNASASSDNVRREDILLGSRALAPGARALAAALGARARDGACSTRDQERSNLRGRGGAGFATG